MTPALLVEYTDKLIDSSKVSLESSRISITSENFLSTTKNRFLVANKGNYCRKNQKYFLSKDIVSK